MKNITAMENTFPTNHFIILEPENQEVGTFVSFRNVGF